MEQSSSSWVLVTSVALALLGCGGSTSLSGGNPAAGGAAGTGAGGNGGGVSGSTALPAQGSLTLTLGSAMVPTSGYACPVNRTYLVGNPAPSDTSPGLPLIDGQGGASIHCSVSASGQSFAVMASLTAGTGDGLARVLFSLNAPVVTTANPAMAQGSAFTSDLVDTIATTDPGGGCVLNVVNDELKPGAFWGMFGCPRLTAPPSTECGASGTFVFQDCAGS